MYSNYITYNGKAVLFYRLIHWHTASTVLMALHIAEYYTLASYVHCHYLALVRNYWAAVKVTILTADSQHCTRLIQNYMKISTCTENCVF